MNYLNEYYFISYFYNDKWFCTQSQKYGQNHIGTCV